MNKKIYISIAVFFGLLISENVSAQLLIEQGKIELDVRAGDTIIDSITIHNTSDENGVSLRAYIEDFEYKKPFKGQKNFFAAGTTQNSLIDWITFSPQTFELSPKSKKKINYTVRIPDDAKGGFYGVLFFESAGDKPEGKIGLRLVSRVGALFFVETTDKTKKASLDNFSIDVGEIKFDLTNQGDVILIPRGVYYFLDRNNLVVDRGELDNFYLPPNQTANVSIPISSDIGIGEYTTVITFDMTEGDLLVKEVDFSKDSKNTFEIIELRD